MVTALLRMEHEWFPTLIATRFATNYTERKPGFENTKEEALRDQRRL